MHGYTYPLSKPVPCPDIVLLFAPKEKDPPNEPGLLNDVVLPVFPKTPLGFCWPNSVELPPKFKPVLVPK